MPMTHVCDRLTVTINPGALSRLVNIRKQLFRWPVTETTNGMGPPYTIFRHEHQIPINLHSTITAMSSVPQSLSIDVIALATNHSGKLLWNGVRILICITCLKNYGLSNKGGSSGAVSTEFSLPQIPDYLLTENALNIRCSVLENLVRNGVDLNLLSELAKVRTRLRGTLVAGLILRLHRGNSYISASGIFLKRLIKNLT